MNFLIKITAFFVVISTILLGQLNAMRLRPRKLLSLRGFTSGLAAIGVFSMEKLETCKLNPNMTLKFLLQSKGTYLEEITKEVGLNQKEQFLLSGISAEKTKLIHLAAAIGDANLMSQLLKHPECNPNVCTENVIKEAYFNYYFACNIIPLHLAVLSSNENKKEIVSLLLNNPKTCANLDIKFDQGRKFYYTPFDLVVRIEDKELASFFIEQQMKPIFSPWKFLRGGCHLELPKILKKIKKNGWNEMIERVKERYNEEREKFYEDYEPKFIPRFKDFSIKGNFLIYVRHLPVTGDYTDENRILFNPFRL